MECESQLIKDVLEFLTALKDVSLPDKFESIREHLSDRLHKALPTNEWYLEMKPSKPILKHSVLSNTSDDYIEPAPSSFLHSMKNGIDSKNQNVHNSKSNISDQSSPYLTLSPSEDIIPQPSVPQISRPLPAIPVKEVEKKLFEEYSEMNMEEAKDKAQKFGLLQRRKKGYFIDNLKSLWAALMKDSFFLCYDVKNDAKPLQVIHLKGCMCQPMNAVQRNIKRTTNSGFDIALPSDMNIQFIAPTPDDMQQWVETISQVRMNVDKYNLHQPLANVLQPVTNHITKAESTSVNSIPNEDYDNIIPDITCALAVPQKVFKQTHGIGDLRQSPSVGLSTSSIETQKPKIAVNASLDKSPSKFPACMHRVLPAPPPSTHLDEDKFYNTIDDFEGGQRSQNPCCRNIVKRLSYSPSSLNREDDKQKIYDDIDILRNEVEVLRENDQRERQKETANEEDESETYDDVLLLESKNQSPSKIMKISTKVIPESGKKEKRIPTESHQDSPKFRSLFERMGILSKSESLRKEDSKQKEVPASSRQRDEISSLAVPLNQNSTKTKDCYPNNKLPDLADYISPPLPRPIHVDKSLTDDDNEQSIYDDVGKRESRNNDTCVPFKCELQKDKSKVSLTKFNTINEDNIESSQSLTGNSEYYKIPRALNSDEQISGDDLEDNETEKIYDDVDIVAQKKKGIDQAKQKLPLKSPSKSNQGFLASRTTENKMFDKINKFSSSILEKSPEKKVHLFNSGKKPKIQEIIPLETNRKFHGANEIYDDCHVNG